MSAEAMNEVVESIEESQENVVEESEYDDTSTRDAATQAVNEVSKEPLSAVENKALKAELKRALELKIDGEGKEYDLDNEEHLDELRKLAQMGGAGQKRMQEAAQMRREVESLLAELKQNPGNILSELGINVEDFAEQIIQNKISELQKSPEQIQQEKRDKELDELRAKVAKAEKEREEAEMMRYQEQASIEIDNEITAALEQNPDLPRVPYTVKRIADAMIYMYENGNENVKVADVIPHVKKQIISEIKDLVHKLPEDYLDSYLDESVYEKARKSRIAKMKKAQPVAAPKVADVGMSNKVKKAPEPIQPIQMKEFLFGKKK